MITTATPPATPQRPPPASSGGAPRRNVASQLLKRQGLVRNGGDVQMRDQSGSRTTGGRIRSHIGMSRDILRKGHSTGFDKLRVSLNRSAMRGDAKTLILRPTATPVHVLEGMQKIINKRFNPQAQFLDLNKLSADPGMSKLRGNHTAATRATTDQREFSAILRIAAQLQPPVLSLSCNENRLTATSITFIHRHLPNIVNLSLAGNKISSLDGLSTLHFKKLRELILKGNPVRENAISNGQAEKYFMDVARRWPTLEMLDDVSLPRGRLAITPVTPAEPVVSTSVQNFPMGMSGSAIESDVQSFAVSFLQRFLAAFDQDRAALAPVYTAISTFSFSYDASIPHRARARGFQVKMPNQKNLSWGKWHELGSRNLHRVIQASPEVAATAAKDMLYTGTGDVMQCFSMMPRTRHDTNEGEKFVIDASSMDIGLGPTLHITVHGQFVEEPGMVDGIRSFDRTMILVPAPPDSDVYRLGWSAFVASDMLTVRGYSSHDTWIPGPLITQPQALADPGAANALSSAAATASGAVPPAQAQPAVEDDGIPPGTPEFILKDPLLPQLAPKQRQIAITLMSETGLTLKTATECLGASSWDMEAALQLFQSVKDTIPKEAFIQL